jgi:hypothetical protein
MKSLTGRYFVFGSIAFGGIATFAWIIALLWGSYNAICLCQNGIGMFICTIDLSALVAGWSWLESTSMNSINSLWARAVHFMYSSSYIDLLIYYL